MCVCICLSDREWYRTWWGAFYWWCLIVGVSNWLLNRYLMLENIQGILLLLFFLALFLCIHTDIVCILRISCFFFYDDLFFVAHHLEDYEIDAKAMRWSNQRALNVNRKISKKGCWEICLFMFMYRTKITTSSWVVSLEVHKCARSFSSISVS